jgi:hypothetical protein
MIYAIIAKLVRPLRMRHTVVLGDIEADISPLPHNSLISLNSILAIHLSRRGGGFCSLPLIAAPAILGLEAHSCGLI